ncbi:MAG: BTAD domain-containing putative transcriptional regulator [Longimicrobiales bacterium]
MLLRTLGGLAIEVPPGDGPAPSLGPRRLALLALVAAAGARGITREKILGILWPETDEEQARHTLSQTLYSLRRDTGRECITGSTQLRLDSTIRSDVREFQEALDADRLTHAAEMYGGPFLDGFYLPGAPAFEEWVEETRSRLQFAQLKALETLARRAVEAGAAREAAHWWQRLCAIEPFSALYTAGRIRALISAGDHIAALRVGREYESRMLRELDSAPDPVVAELIAQLRVPPANAVPAPAPTPALSAAETNAAAERIPSVFRRLAFAAALASFVILAVVAWGIRRSNAAAAPPFLAIGSIESRDSASLAGVLRDMLATNLARVDGIQVVATSRLLELMPRPAGTAATTDAARRAGANEIVEGELALTAGGWMLTLRRVALRSGVVRRGYTVRAADLYALTDSATAAIAHDFRMDPPPNAVAMVRTSSATAYAILRRRTARIVWRGSSLRDSLDEGGARARLDVRDGRVLRLDGQQRCRALRRDEPIASAGAQIGCSHYRSRTPVDSKHAGQRGQAGSRVSGYCA